MRRKVSQIFGKIAAFKFPKPIQNFINSNYVKYFKIDMSEFKTPGEYDSLTALFTRELMIPRKFDEASNIFISPSDGVCLECGTSNLRKALSIKGHEYSITELLGSALGEEGARQEEFGYANIYLSPRDYHRYHAPCDIEILSALYIPGDLYSVSVKALEKVENLYALNERVVLKCRISNKKIVWLVFVGALNVGKMKFIFDDRIQTNAMASFVQSYEYENLSVRKGELLGYFELGSTIVIVGEKDSLELNLFNSKVLKFGDSVGMIKA
ncbi:phosphatidylserine decarboxylase [Campylobacter sp. RM16192]|uniref:phosphatidylserine decarboxylase n=1 Tax=Campylobacter sp. RM16192 TaxID=1660080 RepID=UPI0014529E17|nr:phosphatidylserine decarboxylase [Campylobacter sp. RM16192]QCD52947.1 phosphatidylserine decarboxylase, proenzyme [Campylobacter sp. RM16192]